MSSLNRIKTTNKSKHLLADNEFKKLKTYDSSYFIDKSNFEEDGTQNYLVFQPRYRYFKQYAGVGTGDYIYYWQSKGLSDKIIISIEALNYSITPKLDYYGTKTRANFNGKCLKQDTITYTHGKVVNTHIFYELTGSSSNNNDPTIRYFLFGAVTLTKNPGID